MHVIISHETLPIPGKNRPTLVIYSLYSSPNSEELSRDSSRRAVTIKTTTAKIKVPIVERWGQIITHPVRHIMKEV